MREIFQDNGSRLFYANGATLSWFVGTISPNIQGWMDKYQYKSMLGGINGRGSRLCHMLLPRGGDPLSWSGCYLLTVGMALGLESMALGSYVSGYGAPSPHWRFLIHFPSSVIGFGCFGKLYITFYSIFLSFKTTSNMMKHCLK